MHNEYPSQKPQWLIEQEQRIQAAKNLARDLENYRWREETNKQSTIRPYMDGGFY